MQSTLNGTESINLFSARFSHIKPLLESVAIIKNRQVIQIQRFLDARGLMKDMKQVAPVN